MLAMLVFSIYMARTLGRDVYGLISIAIGVFGIATIVGDVGLNVASARYTAVHRKSGEYGDVKAILLSSLFIKVVSAALLTFLLIIFSSDFNILFSKPVSGLITIIALALLFNLPASAFQAVIRGSHRMDLYAGANMFRDLIWAISSIVLVMLGYGVRGAVMGYLLGQIAWLIANVLEYIIFLRVSDKPTPLAATGRKLVLFGLPVITMDIMIFLYNWTDTFVIGIFRPTWEVSCYNIAFGMINMVMVLIASVSTAVFPIFSEKSRNASGTELSEIFYRLTKMVSLAVYPMLTAIVVFGPYLIVIYGKQYLPGLMSLWILAIWGYFRPYGNMSNTMLTALGKQKYVLYTTTTVAFLNVLGNFILVPIWGMNGAAVSSTVSITAGTFVSLGYLKGKADVSVNLRTPISLFGTSIATILPFYLIMLWLDAYLKITNSLIMLVAVLALLLPLYMLICVVLAGKIGIIDRDDVQHIRRATEKIPLSKSIIKLVFG